MKWLQAQWAANGTKILGVLLTLEGVCYTVADDVLELIPRESRWRGTAKLLFGIMGYFVLRRGQGNSRVLMRPPP